MKIRAIHMSKDKGVVYGMTIPHDIALFYSGVHFTIIQQKERLVFESGCSPYPTNKEIENYNFEDCRCGDCNE